jgi:hypothetical protein
MLKLNDEINFDTWNMRNMWSKFAALSRALVYFLSPGTDHDMTSGPLSPLIGSPAVARRYLGASAAASRRRRPDYLTLDAGRGESQQTSPVTWSPQDSMEILVNGIIGAYSQACTVEWKHRIFEFSTHPGDCPN